MGQRASVDEMAGVKIRVQIRDQQVSMSLLDLWQELEDSWREQVSCVLQPGVPLLPCKHQANSCVAVHII